MIKIVHLWRSWYNKIVHLWREEDKMTKRYKNSFRIKALRYIETLDKEVILRADLNNLGEPRQISRALKTLLEDGQLIKLGYGIYVKAERTQYSSQPIIIVPIAQAFAAALDRLNIRWELGQAIQDYNEGRTQQVPSKFIVRLKDRFRGRLGIGKRQLIVEDGINAR